MRPRKPALYDELMFSPPAKPVALQKIHWLLFLTRSRTISHSVGFSPPDSTSDCMSPRCRLIFFLFVVLLSIKTPTVFSLELQAQCPAHWATGTVTQTPLTPRTLLEVGLGWDENLPVGRAADAARSSTDGSTITWSGETRTWTLRDLVGDREE